MTEFVKRAQVVLRLVWESVQFAVSSLKGNRFRTLLSLLGVTIGIFTIVLVLSIVGGLKSNIRKGLDSLGGSTITVQREPWEVEDGETWNWWEFAKRPPVDVKDYEFVKRHSELSQAVTFFSGFSSDIHHPDGVFSGGNVVSIATGFEEIFAVTPERGRWFLHTELEGRGNICFIGSEVAKGLFEGGSPIGEKVKLRGSLCTVIGVAPPQGESIADIFDIDNSIFIPLGFGEIIAGTGGGGAIAIAPKDGVEQGDLIDEVRFLVRSHRGIRTGEADNFSVNRMSYLSSAVDDVFRKINLVGWIVGGFALLIGGFGIANILFVSVRERMPQIGIQKALGARDYVILTQFISEAAILSSIGGAFGILIVVIISLILGNNSGIPFELGFDGVAAGVMIALMVGIAAGVVPAYSAARMDPIKAINL